MPDPIDSLAMVLTTSSTLQEAESIAHLLVAERLAACVQISGPVTSIYQWEGTIEKSSEYRIVAKIRLASWLKLKQRLIEVHSYDEPQVVLVKIDDSSEGYTKWLLSETSLN